MKKYIPLLFVVLLCSCVSDSTHDEIVTKLQALQVENNKLNEELAKYKLKPEKLVTSAKLAFDEQNKVELLEIKNLLVNYHPESSQLKVVDEYIAKLISIKNQERLAKEVKIKAAYKRKMAVVNKLKKEHDDVSNITWYYNPYFTHYSNTNRISLYIGQENSRVWLRLKMSYQGDNWIFFENAYLSYDGNTQPISFNRYDEKETENSGGGVWEWIDVSVDKRTLEFLNKMIEGKKIKMRLSGKYTKTRNLSRNEKRALTDVLLAYDVLKEESRINK